MCADGLRFLKEGVRSTRGRKGEIELETPNAGSERLLLLHHDPVVREKLSEACRQSHWRVEGVATVDDALDRLSSNAPPAVVAISAACVAHHAAASTGNGAVGNGASHQFFDVLYALVHRNRDAQSILITDEPLDLEACCEAVRQGVSAFYSLDDRELDVDGFVRRAGIAMRRHQKNTAQRAEVEYAQSIPTDALIWESSAMASLLAKSARAAQVSDVPVLIHGESGTGKQLVAELIHQLDPKRAHKPFICVNCSAISGSLAESTLFGHVKGAFTGATESRKGHFRAADGGTILLDEIGEMDLTLQPKLLRVLQSGMVMPVGADREEPVDVRVIAATNRRLAAQVDHREFRLDLYQRLNVIALEIPPLRERPEDIPALVRHFVGKYAGYCASPVEQIDDEVLAFFGGCPLRGNVRELENTIRQMLALKRSGNRLTLGDVPLSMRGQGWTDEQNYEQVQTESLIEMTQAAGRLLDSGAMTLPQLISACEKMLLRSALEHSKSTSASLAQQLGMSRRTLYNKINKYDLPAPRELAKKPA